MIYGYARVSTDGQSVEAQVAALTAAGAVKVYREVASGAKTDRAQLRQALAKLVAGDVLLVTRLDRLARSTRDLLNTLAAITGTGAGFKSLGDVWADTTTPHGRLLLTVLGGLAEFERELIRARTSEGRARAKARGVHLGRRPKLTPYQRRASSDALLQRAYLSIGDRETRQMDDELRQKILTLLDQHRIMTLATLRSDGWPQATTVGYANDGLTLYFLCGRESQKAANLARDDRVSLTIDHDTPQVMDITGLSMAAHAKLVVDATEVE